MVKEKPVVKQKLMVRQKLSVTLDDLDKAKQQNFWQSRLIEMQGLLREKRYSALSRRISDLLECDRVTGRIKPPKSEASKNRDE